MAGLTSRALGIALSLCTLAACTSGPEDTIEPPGTSGRVTGGEIIVTGDLDAASPDTTVSTVAPPAPATSATLVTTTSTATRSAAPASTTRPTTATTTRPTTATTTRPTTTEAEVIGDGPVLTGPGRDGTAESPGIGDAPLLPVFFVIDAAVTVDCSAANPGTARLRWEVIGTETVDIAIGAATKIFRLAQPPAGTLDVPLDCADGSTYFVVASNADGTARRSVTLAADATG